MVIGDIDDAGAQGTVDQIKSLGGYVLSLCACNDVSWWCVYDSDAVFKRCDVTSWDEQVDLYDFAISRYNSVDIVVRACAAFAQKAHALNYDIAYQDTQRWCQ